MDIQMSSIEEKVLNAIIMKCIAEDEDYYIGQASDINEYAKIEEFQLYNALQRLKDKSYIHYVDATFIQTWVTTNKLVNMIEVEKEKIDRQINLL